MCLIQLHILIKHLYLNGIWLGVVPKTDTYVFKRDWTMCSNMTTILGSIVNIFEGTYLTFHEHKNMHDSINLTTCSFCGGAYHGFEASPVVHKNLSSRAHRGELLDTIFESKQKLSNAFDTVIQMRTVCQRVHQLHPSIRLSDWAGSCSVVLASHTQKSHPQKKNSNFNNQIMNMYTLIQISWG